MKQISVPVFLASIVLLLGIAACASAPIPTATPVPVTATIISRPATLVATATPAPSEPAATATVQSILRTDVIEFLTTLSSDDTVAVVDDVQKLEGVKNAQSSGQAIQVTYDPTKVSLQQIITSIEDYGVQVKK